MNLKFIFICSLLLFVELFSANIEQGEIALTGVLSFKEIIREAEDQLGIDIKMPSSADSKSKKNYNQTITIDQLIKAITNNYAQEGIPVDWKYNNHILTIFRTDKIKRKVRKKVRKKKPRVSESQWQRKKRTPPVKEARNQEQADSSTIFVQSKSPESKNDYPHRPDWIKMPSLNEPTPKKPLSYTHEEPELTSFEEPKRKSFSVTIPRKKVKLFPKEKTYPYQTTPPYQSVIKQQRKHSSKKKLKVTPYPQKATAFINDAPSISNYTGLEIYIEWETRMKGALQQGNGKVLHREKAELEKRLRWLRNNF